MNKLITFAVSAILAAKVNGETDASGLDDVKESYYYSYYDSDTSAYYEEGFYSDYDAYYSSYYDSNDNSNYYKGKSDSP